MAGTREATRTREDTGAPRDAASVTPRRRAGVRRVALGVAVATVIGIGGAVTLGSPTPDLTPAEIAAIRYEAMGDHYLRLWLTEQEQAEVARAEALVDHDRRVRRQRLDEIRELRARAMVEHYERLWREGVLTSG